MRFRAPAREEVAASTFDHPIFADVQPWREWLTASNWPCIADMDVALASTEHSISGRRLRVVAQTPTLLADGLHYESRILERAAIATREGNWHDLLNALIWLAHGPIKSALNARQVVDIERVGSRIRTRGQCALTHFDEAGIVLVLRDSARLEAWDQHDWVGVFHGLKAADFAVAVVGHALLEHALKPGQLLVGKALAVIHPKPSVGLADALASIANAIGEQRLLLDPQELRPLPLVGLPGWHPQSGKIEFLQSAPCFAPKREQRRYPLAFAVSEAATPSLATCDADSSVGASNAAA
ncbi:MAG: DUF3025 domain-containing protein [Pseudomarimonas sp.]